MTANQLQYMANEENIRHNKAYEEETLRHNSTMEGIQNYANVINDNRLKAEVEWRDKDRELTEKIETMKLYQSEEQLKINAEYLALEREKTNAEISWKAADANFKEQQILIEREKTDELVRHNKEQESIGKQNVYASLLDTWASYDVGSTRNRNEYELGQERNRIDYFKATTDRMGTWLDYKLGVDRLQLENDKFMLDQERWAMEKELMPLNTVFGGIKAIGKVAIPFFR